MTSTTEQREPAAPRGSFFSAARRLVFCVGGCCLLIGGTVIGITLEKRRTVGDSAPVSRLPAGNVSSGDESRIREIRDNTAQWPPEPALAPIAPTPAPAPEDAADSLATAETDPLRSSARDSSSSLAIRLARGDDLIQEGNYVAALPVLTPLLESVTGGMQAQVQLRIALCREALGQHPEALAGYRRVVALNVNRAVNEAALLGQTRIWSKSGRLDLATSALYRTLLESPRDGTDRRQLQLPHQLGGLLASRMSPGLGREAGGVAVMDDRSLLAPGWPFRPDRLLEEWSHLDVDDPSAAESSPAAGVTVTHRFSAAPEEIFLTLRHGRVSALDLLMDVTRASGWSTDLSAGARQRLQEHTLQPECHDLPLAIILDALADQYQLTWKIEDGGAEAGTGRSSRILVNLQSEVSDGDRTRQQLAAAHRMLKFACGFAPDHPTAATSYMELGRLTAVAARSAEREGPAFARLTLDQAIRDYRQAIELFPRSEHVPDAWLNIGKLHLQLGELDSALESFRRAVDSMTGHPLEPAAYAYLGRVHLELDTPRAATTPLVRGLALAGGTEFEPVNALLLASAYYLLDNPRGANAVLVDHRRAFKDRALYDQAACLAALIRFQAATDPRKRDAEGATLMTALSNLKSSRTFGGHWAYLIGMAYRETGMETLALSTFADSLSGPYSFPLQERMRSRMLSTSPVTARTARPLAPTAGAPAPADPVRFEVELAEAQQAFRGGRHDETLRVTRKLLGQPEVPPELRREALRLMGRVFQIRGDHRQAVLCFTGVIPDEEPPQVEESRGATKPGVLQ